MPRMIIRLEVFPVDGSERYELDLTTRDFAVWERTGRDRVMNKFMAAIDATGLYQVSHIAARREGLFTGTLAEWKEAVDLNAIDPDEVLNGSDDEDEESIEDPTQ